MTTTTVSVLYGIGGYDESLPNNNLVEQVALVGADDGTWTREVRDGAGNVLEVTPAEAPVLPAEPASVDAPADANLKAQVAALTAELDRLRDALGPW